MYAAKNDILLSATGLHYILGFTLSITQPGRSLIVGFSCVAQGFSLTCMRKWTFGTGYNHPAGVLRPFVLTTTSLRYYSLTFSIFWVGIHKPT